MFLLYFFDKTAIFLLFNKLYVRIVKVFGRFYVISQNIREKICLISK